MGKRSRSRIRLAARQGRPLPPPPAAAVPGEPSGLARLAELAARQREVQAATLNHRHFRVVRPRHAAAFELLP